MSTYEPCESCGAHVSTAAGDSHFCGPAVVRPCGHLEWDGGEFTACMRTDTRRVGALEWMCPEHAPRWDRTR